MTVARSFGSVAYERMGKGWALRRLSILVATWLGLCAGCARFQTVELTLLRPPRQAGKIGQIRSLAILGFSYGEEPQLAVQLHDRFAKEIADSNAPFQIVERRELDIVREELARQYKATFDERLRAEVGKFLPATHVLVGTVEKFSVADRDLLQWDELTEAERYRASFDPMRTADYELQWAHRTNRVRVGELSVSYRVVKVEDLSVLFADQVSEVYTSRSSLVAPPPSKAELKAVLVERVSQQLLHNFVPYSATVLTRIRRGRALAAGNTCLTQGLLEEAVAHYSQMAERDDSPAAYYNLGIAYELMHNYADAEKAFKKALELEPNEKFYAGALARVRSSLKAPAPDQQ